VIFPDHLHTVCTIWVDDGDYAPCWTLIKGTSQRIPQDARRHKSRIGKGEMGVWQRR
jgi:putative transposase